MLKWLLAFTIIPLLELALLIKIGGYVGVLPTIVLVISTGFIGVFLARAQGFRLLRQIQRNMENGIVPGNELLEGLLLLIGGIFLITPGLITDTAGFLLLLPWTRVRMREILKRKLARMIREGTFFIRIH